MADASAVDVTFGQVVEAVGRAIDAVGVGAIALGIALVAFLAARRLVARDADVYGSFRQQLGRAILLGLELLVAADIIRTVAVTPTIESVAVLGGIVLVRTFLSFSLEVELTGRWPWQRGGGEEGGARAGVDRGGGERDPGAGAPSVEG
jgi:uncharacterized membrane protein